MKTETIVQIEQVAQVVQTQSRTLDLIERFHELPGDWERFEMLENLPLQDQINIASSLGDNEGDHEIMSEIWGSVEKCYEWVDDALRRRDASQMTGDNTEARLKNTLEELGLNDVPYKQYYIMFRDKQNAHLLGNMLGQLVFWSSRTGRVDGKFWKSDDELAYEIVTKVRTVCVFR